ncbi:MAG: beta-aspartyl-peptidase [Candidatus Aminicenantes bacterium]|nr:beta-aspartyl-peptidase [Candidatus Aminicenantes bacterium]
MIVIKQGRVFSPHPLGIKDILIAGSTIIRIEDPGKITIKGTEVEEIDASRQIITPGLIDSHVHILGGGGEGGPKTRAPEIKIEDIISSGVSTVIGCLGTDSVTRHMESLYAKAKGLENEGVTTYIFSGSYEVPTSNLTGSIKRDLVLIDKVIGAGEIAVSDHRSSQPSFSELARLAAECRVGGMLGGKAGILHCHLGDGQRKLDMLFRLIEETEIPPSQIIPTHCNRNPDLLEEAIRFNKKGGFMDLTADLDPEQKNGSLISIRDTVQRCIDCRAHLDQITVSSDGNGSLPVFNEQGELTGLTIADQKSLLNNLVFLIENKILGMDNALKLFTLNPAVLYNLDKKGRLSPGCDADINIFDSQFNLIHSWCMGKKMIHNQKLAVHGTFSPESNQ